MLGASDTLLVSIKASYFLLLLTIFLNSKMEPGVHPGPVCPWINCDENFRFHGGRNCDDKISGKVNSIAWLAHNIQQQRTLLKNIFLLNICS